MAIYDLETTIEPVIAYRAKMISPFTGQAITRFGESREDAKAAVDMEILRQANDRGLSIERVSEHSHDLAEHNQR